MSQTLPLPVSVSAAYRVRLARDEAEIRAAQRLRFVVFNLELGEGLESSYRVGRDEDRFDSVCDHLIVVHGDTREVVGTYRMQTGLSALAREGYYSEQEFDFRPLEPYRAEMIELGRACVHRDHRNLSVLGLLWRGIGEYAVARRARYLVGCSSLPTKDPAAGRGAYRRLEQYLAPVERRTAPRPGWECPLTGPGEDTSVPKLMQAYLAMGAEICGAPALDREFGSIDFLTWLDLERLPPSARKRFLG